jgi:hypothetical protein
MKTCTFLAICSLIVFTQCKNNSAEVTATPETVPVVLPEGYTRITRASEGILLNGIGDDTAWSATEWKPIDQVWLGSPMAASDFGGRYKVLWDANFLYVLAEIQDDSLTDTHTNGLEKYWDDDCLEVFLDENASGGDHQYNYNAFAYHLSLDHHAVDIAADSSFQFFDQHVTFKRVITGKTSVWEGAFRIYKDDYTNAQDAMPSALKSGKKMGFMLAYCDNDKSKERENFIGTVPMTGEDKNRGWIDASVFEKVVLE